MLILGIDPAKKTGLALLRDGKVIHTRPVNIRNAFDIGALAIHIEALLIEYSDKTDPIRVIIEHPFFPQRSKDDEKNKRSLQAYETHLAKYHAWLSAIYRELRYTAKFPKAYVNDRDMKFRIVWPATWQSALNLRNVFLASSIKDASKRVAMANGAEDGLTHDEYDACNIAYYYWLMSRPLDYESTGDPDRDRLLNIINNSKYVLPTKSERNLFTGKDF